MIESTESIAARVRSGEISPVELVEQSLEAIDRLNPVLNAFVSLRGDQARAEASAMADAIAGGDDPGPLAGIPIGIKDLQDVTGMVTTKGSRLHLEDPPATSDDIEVARLRAAGAIVVGKTNTPEFAWSGYTNPPAFGPTRNPWNIEKTSGGSSGGSSSAIASAMVPGATASDGGGSIRIPANFAGLFGLKPNNGRIGHDSIATWPFFSVAGPLTRTVRDAAIWLDITAGPAVGDPFSLPAPTVSYLDALETEYEGGPVYASLNLGWGPVDPETRRVVTTAIDRLGEIGAKVDEISAPIPEDPFNYWLSVSSADGAFYQGSNLESKGDLYDPMFRLSLQVGNGVERSTYQMSLAKRYEFCRAIDELLGDDGLLVSAVTMVPPFAAEGPHPTEVDGQSVPPSGFTRTYPFNFTGNPAASIPCGLTSDGLPIGLQVVGPRFREEKVLRFARAFEEAWPWDLPDVSGLA